MKGPSLSEQLDAHLENRERLDFAKEVERETRADVLRQVRETLGRLESGSKNENGLYCTSLDVKQQALAAIDKLDNKEADG